MSPLPPVCGQNDCPEPAVARFFWPGCDPRLVCSRHRTAILHVASALDLVLYVEPLVVGALDLVPLDDAARAILAGDIDGPDGPITWYVLTEGGKPIGYLSTERRRAPALVARMNGARLGLVHSPASSLAGGGDS
jgi:hypothetical protein